MTQQDNTQLLALIDRAIEAAERKDSSDKIIEPLIEAQQIIINVQPPQS